MSKMKKIIHFEDKEKYQIQLKHSLLHVPDLEIIAFDNYESYRKLNYPDAELYVLDRHFLERKGESPNDSTWRTILNVLNSLNPERPVVTLSRFPTREFWRYPNVTAVFSKSDFETDSIKFVQTIENLLGGVRK